MGELLWLLECFLFTSHTLRLILGSALTLWQYLCLLLAHVAGRKSRKEKKKISGARKGTCFLGMCVTRDLLLSSGDWMPQQARIEQESERSGWSL